MVAIATAATALWRGEPGPLERVSDSANHVFTFVLSGERRFLRLTPGARRARTQIEAEMDFVTYLHGHGVCVSLPVASGGGRTVEEIPAGGRVLFACVFEEAVGESFVFSSREADREHFRLRGRTLGRMHALAKRYTPIGGRRRFRWHEDDLFREVEAYLPRSEEAAWAEYRELTGWLSARPTDRDSFGLIHGDFGPTNFRQAGGRLTVFDFDDSCYHWFAYDLAVTIYPHGRREGASALLESLLEGYAGGADSTPPRRDELIKLCRLRQLYMFLHYAKAWGLTDLSSERAGWFDQKRDNMARGYTLSA
jgi:Ser/Thr protein kinase RdoA (MazF antagonist)